MPDDEPELGGTHDPIPRHLHPLSSALEVPDDLIVVLRAEELAQIARAVAAIVDARSVRVVHRDGSPWIELGVATGPELAEPFPPADMSRYGVRRLALWRYTLAVYELDEHGAVGDDPIAGFGGDRSWREAT
jgi:hypothetical protein